MSLHGRFGSLLSGFSPFPVAKSKLCTGTVRTFFFLVERVLVAIAGVSPRHPSHRSSLRRGGGEPRNLWPMYCGGNSHILPATHAYVARGKMTCCRRARNLDIGSISRYVVNALSLSLSLSLSAPPPHNAEHAGASIPLQLRLQHKT